MAVVLLVQTAMRKMRQRALSHALGVLGVAIITCCWCLRCCCGLLLPHLVYFSRLFRQHAQSGLQFPAHQVCAVPQQMACA
jgi:hypothetical protein